MSGDAAANLGMKLRTSLVAEKFVFPSLLPSLVILALLVCLFWMHLMPASQLWPFQRSLKRAVGSPFVHKAYVFALVAHGLEAAITLWICRVREYGLFTSAKWTVSTILVGYLSLGKLIAIK